MAPQRVSRSSYALILWLVCAFVWVHAASVAADSPSTQQQETDENTAAYQHDRRHATHRTAPPHEEREPLVVYEVSTDSYDGSVRWEVAETPTQQAPPSITTTHHHHHQPPTLAERQAFVDRMQATLDALLRYYEEQGTHVMEGEHQTINELKQLIEQAAPIMTAELLQELPELYEQLVDAQTMADELMVEATRVKRSHQDGLPPRLLSDTEPSEAFLDIEDHVRSEGLTPAAVAALEALADVENDLFAHESLAFLSFFEPNATHNRDFDSAFARLRAAADGGLGVSSSLLGLFSLIDFGSPRNTTLDVAARRRMAEHLLLDLAREQEFTASLVVAYRMLRGESSDALVKGDACQNAVRYYHRCAESNVQQLGLLGTQRPYDLLRLSEEARLPSDPIEAEGEGVQRFEYFRSIAANPMDEQWAEATAHLGEMYFYGDDAAGVPQDFEQATAHFRRAADAGDALAQANYAMMLAEGTGVKQDNATALQYFRLAAAQGNGFAMHGLGLMYLSGAGVVKDEARAFEYFTKAVEFGFLEAHTYLGAAYAHGRGVPRNESKAFEHYQEAAAATGSPQALFDLGVLYYRGAGGAWSCGDALGLFRRVATDPVLLADLPFSMERAHDCYRHGDYVRAYLQYRLLAEFGSEEAQTNAAFLLETHGDEILSTELWMGERKQPLSEARQLYEHAAALNDTEAMRKTGECHYRGWHGACEQNATRAMAEYARAAALGDPEAAFNCGAMLATGDGVARDFESATRHFEQCTESPFPENVPCALALGVLRVAVAVRDAVGSVLSY